VLDFLIQRRRDAQAAKKLMVKLLKKHGFAPSRVVTDRLRSYPAAFRAIGLTAEHDRGLRANNRAENSHQPIRRRERKLQRFKSPGSVQRFLISRSFALLHSALGLKYPPLHDACCPLHSPQLNADNVTKPLRGFNHAVAHSIGAA
jgi:transposase-like protein